MLKVTLSPDEAPESPRTWGNLGKMWCEHQRYTLDDACPWWWQQLLKYGYLEAERYSREFRCTTIKALFTKSWDDHEALMIEQQKRDGEPLALWLPVYLYNHSGLALSTKPFYDRWDSGQVGFIVATQKDVREFFGVERISKRVRTLAYKRLEAEVQTYHQYLSGDVWDYLIEDENGEIVDSLSGMYGYDYASEMAEQALSYIQEAL